MVKSVPGTGGSAAVLCYPLSLTPAHPPSLSPHRVLYGPTLNISEDKLERLVIGITDVSDHVLFIQSRASCTLGKVSTY